MDTLNHIQLHNAAKAVCEELGAPVHHIGIDTFFKTVLFYRTADAGYHGYDFAFETPMDDLEVFKTNIRDAVAKRYAGKIRFLSRIEWDAMTPDQQWQYVKAIEQLNTTLADALRLIDHKLVDIRQSAPQIVRVQPSEDDECDDEMTPEECEEFKAKIRQWKYEAGGRW